MQSEWHECTLGEFVRLQRGHDLTASEQQPGPVPVMGSAGPNGTHSKALAKGPGVLIGRSGASIGRVHYSAVDYWPHNTCLYVTDFLGNQPRFVYYLLRTLELAGYNSGSAQPSLNRNYIYGMRIRVPKRGEQERIVEVLQAVDDRIDLLRQTNATLESIAQALFKSWFIDFDPVRAKAEGREPKGMDAATAAVFPADLEVSELGLIPKGWHIATLPEAVDINPSESLPKGVEARYLEMANAPTSGHRPIERVPQRAFGSGCKFRNGDALLAKITPCLENGKSAFVDFLGDAEVGWGSTEFIVLRSKAILPQYGAYLLARHEPFRRYAVQAMTGTSGRQRVDMTRLQQFQMALPPDSVIARAIDPMLRAFQSRIANNDEQAKTLASLRDAMLPRLISGKLRVPRAADQIEEVLA